MIITQGDRKASIKATDVSRSLQPSDQPPPAYQTASSSSQPEMVSSTTPLNSNPAPAYGLPSAVPKRDSPRLRFFKAFIVALGIYILIGMSIGSITSSTSNAYRHWGKPSLPERKDGTIAAPDHCQPDWSEVFEPDHDFDDEISVPFPTFPVENQASFPGLGTTMLYKAQYSLPLQLESVYFLTRGDHSSGSIRYESAPEDAKNITISVEMRYWYKEARESVNMCILTRSKTDMGFGIFTPKGNWDWTPRERRFVRFDVVVRIPGPETRPPRLRTLSSDLRNFAQYIDLLDHRTWNSVNLESTNGGIYVTEGSNGQLDAHKLSLTTTNAPIVGHFWTDNTLELKTTNAKIDAEVTIVNSDKPPTSVSLITTNGNVDAVFKPFTVSGKGGSYDLLAKTTNNKLNISVPSAPIDSVIHLTGSTTNGRADVLLSRQVEGAFRLSTSNAPIVATHNLKSGDDPKKEGRSPNLSFKTVTKRFVEGSFFWGSPLVSRLWKEGTTIEISTTNARNTLTFV